MPWAQKMCAEFTADNLEMLTTMRSKPEGRQMVVDIVKQSPYRERDAAANMGSLLHEYAEALTTGAPLPAVSDQLAGFVAHLELFIQEWRPKVLLAERTVFNFRYGYAGTFDLVAEIPGHGTALCDYKTGRPGKQGHGIYPETVLQLNAYAGAEFYVSENGTEQPLPPIDELLAVNIRDNGYHVVPCEKSDRAFRSWLYAMQTARFVNDGGDMVGEPLAPPLTVVK